MILFGSLLLSGCEKDYVFCSYENEFCAAIQNKVFDQTGKYVDLYLKTLKFDDTYPDIPGEFQEQKLEDLKKWLACKKCVQSANIICNSCILTYPPQSEIGIHFITSDTVIFRVMDVKMTSPLKFVRYHE